MSSTVHHLTMRKTNRSPTRSTGFWLAVMSGICSGTENKSSMHSSRWYRTHSVCFLGVWGFCPIIFNIWFYFLGKLYRRLTLGDLRANAENYKILEPHWSNPFLGTFQKQGQFSEEWTVQNGTIEFLSTQSIIWGTLKWIACSSPNFRILL